MRVPLSGTTATEPEHSTELAVPFLQHAGGNVVSNSEHDTSAPLKDLVVLDFTVARAGPTAVRYLADWGAEVLRIESADPSLALINDRNSSDYINLHRGKRIIELDLGDAGERQRVYELVRTADVVVESFRPQVKYKLGIDYATLSRINPRLIYGSISGYGQEGPCAQQGAVDQVVQGVAGLMAITGDASTGPVRAGIAVSDLAAGHQLAIGLLIALHARARSQRGQWVQVSLLEAMIAFLDFQAVRWTTDGEVPEPAGNHHPTYCPMGTYAARDGHFNVAAPGERLWRQLCVAIERPDLRDDVRFATSRQRYLHRAALNDELARIFAERTRREWIARLDEANVPCGLVLGVDEVFAHPQVEHLAMVAEVEHPSRGRVSVLRNSITMSESSPVRPVVARLVRSSSGWTTTDAHDVGPTEAIR